MPTCSLCGTATSLFANGLPICLTCDERRSHPDKQPRIDSTGLAEVSDGMLYLICPFCGLNSTRGPGTVDISWTRCDHCNKVFTVASEVDVSGMFAGGATPGVVNTHAENADIMPRSNITLEGLGIKPERS